MKSAEIVALTDILVEYWENAFHVKETGNVFSIFVDSHFTRRISAFCDYSHESPRALGKSSPPRRAGTPDYA